MADSVKVDVEIIRGVEGLCVAVNGTRIAGAKPWGGGKVVASWEVDADDIRGSLPAAAPREVEEVRRCACGGLALRAVVVLNVGPGGDLWCHAASDCRVVGRISDPAAAHAGIRALSSSGESPERGPQKWSNACGDGCPGCAKCMPIGRGPSPLGESTDVGLVGAPERDPDFKPVCSNCGKDPT